MSTIYTYEKTVSDFFDQALTLGDPRLIDALIPLHGKPTTVETYKIFKFIKESNLEKISYFLNNFSISINTKCLRHLSMVECYKNVEFHFEQRRRIFELFTTYGFCSSMMSRSNFSVYKVFDTHPVVKNAEHLALADDILTYFNNETYQLSLTDVLSLVEVPDHHFSDNDRLLYSSFFTKWLSKIVWSASNALDGCSKKVLMGLVLCIGTSDLVKVINPILQKFERTDSVMKTEVKVTNISEISMVRSMEEEHDNFRFIYPPIGYQSIDDYFLRESGSDIIWLLQRGDIDSIHQLSNKLYGILYSMSKIPDRKLYLEKLGFVVRNLNKLLDAEAQFKLTMNLSRGIEQNQAITDGKAVRDTLVDFGFMVDDSFAFIDDNFMPVIAMLSLPDIDEGSDRYHRLMSQIIRYEPNPSSKRNMLIGSAHANPKNMGDVVKKYSETLYNKWRSNLPLENHSEEKVLKCILRTKLDDVHATLFHLMSSKSLLTHMAKTKSIGQRQVILEMKNWQGIDVISMSKTFDVKLPDKVKIEMMEYSL